MNTKEYDHQAFKDSLSKEELGEIYSEDEVEEQLRERELRTQGNSESFTLYRKLRKRTHNGQRNKNLPICHQIQIVPNMIFL